MARGTDDELQREHLLQLVARRYWLEGRTQQEVAEELSFSRVSVSRLLDEGRRRGVVRIAVGEPVDRDREQERLLAGLLRRRGGRVLRTCRVVRSLGRSQQADQRLAGREAARVLAGLLEPASRFGIASSRTMAPVLGFTALLPRPSVVVELLGSGRPGRRGGGGAGVGAEAAHLLGARHVDVPTPFVHRTAERAAAARRRDVVQEALEVGCGADVALFGAGSLQRFDGTGAHAPVAAQALAEAAQDGAVGHLLGFFVDRAGAHVPTGVDALRVGIGLDQLRGVPRRVLLARGAERAAVIAGAVAAGLVTDLVTDTAAAAAVLAAATRR